MRASRLPAYFSSGNAVGSMVTPSLQSPDSVFPCVVNQNVLTAPPNEQILFA